VYDDYLAVYVFLLVLYMLNVHAMATSKHYAQVC